MIALINPNDHLYAIYLYVDKEQTIVIGKLGKFTFQKGTYVYVGSTKRNIQARINRHCSLDKVMRWHFDYLRPAGTITKIITYGNDLGECELLEKLRKKENGSFPVKGFGSSDCKCYSHLFYISENK